MSSLPSRDSAASLVTEDCMRGPCLPGTWNRGLRMSACRFSATRPELAPEVERQDQQKDGRDQSWRVSTLAQRPQRVPDAVQQLDRDPEPSEGARHGPVPSDRPEEAPEPEEYERGVEDQESELPVLGDQAADEPGWGKDVEQTAEILLGRVGCLSHDEGEKRSLKARHQRPRSNHTLLSVRSWPWPLKRLLPRRQTTRFASVNSSDRNGENNASLAGIQMAPIAVGDIHGNLAALQSLLDILVAGLTLAHAQFETIHPFLDGNG